ncbi:hypothetical protein [Mycoplasma sp. 1654_15]|uniref:hypothetical protein n=1 Tax=Mycoplasma sp. 1654_15 TaxID=2725994 RepID=UPI00144912D2|nr:hypothetical protein [Mycoplasma sp. 1654_15]QJB70984.1 hypothetical protein HF996_00415 [Mycoplasma sp. 1654_15]
MKKIIFDIGNVSQIPSVLSPVAQSVQLISDNNISEFQVSKIESEMDLHRQISTTEINNQNVELKFLQEIDFQELSQEINYTKKVVKNINFSDNSKVFEVLEQNLEKIGNKKDQEFFKEVYYETLDIIKTRQLSETDLQLLLKGINPTTQDLFINNNSFDENSFIDINPTDDGAGWKNTKEKEIQNQEVLNNRTNQIIDNPWMNISSKSNKFKNTLSNKEKQDILDLIFNDIQTKSEFQNIQKDIVENNEKLKNFYKHYKEFYDINYNINRMSLALSATYAGLAAWYGFVSFFAPAVGVPILTALILQGSVTGAFTAFAFNTEKEIQKDLKDIENFWHSDTFYFLNNFAKKSYSEFVKEMKKKLLNNTYDVSFWFNFAKFATNKSSYKFASKTVLNKLKDSIFSKIKYYQQVRSYENEILKIDIKKIFFKQYWKAASGIFDEYLSFIKAKRIVMITTIFANPIVSFVSLIDNAISITTTMVNLSFALKTKKNF